MQALPTARACLEVDYNQKGFQRRVKGERNEGIRRAEEQRGRRECKYIKVMGCLDWPRMYRLGFGDATPHGRRIHDDHWLLQLYLKGSL